jgi:hypothetical protein
MKRKVCLSIIIIISYLQSTAGHRPLQLLASRPAQIVSTWPEGDFTFTKTRSPLQNSCTPAVGSTADMASPLPLQLANTVCYVNLVFCRIASFQSIPQRNLEHSSFHSSLCVCILIKFECLYVLL